MPHCCGGTKQLEPWPRWADQGLSVPSGPGHWGPPQWFSCCLCLGPLPSPCGLSEQWLLSLVLKGESSPTSPKMPGLAVDDTGNPGRVRRSLSLSAQGQAAQSRGFLRVLHVGCVLGSAGVVSALLGDILCWTLHGTCWGSRRGAMQTLAGSKCQCPESQTTDPLVSAPAVWLCGLALATQPV